jgi:hypothetical protein
MTKKEKIEYDILVEEFKLLNDEFFKLKDIIKEKDKQADNLLDLIENKLVNIEDIQKREGLYLEYFDSVKNLFIHKLLFGNKLLKLFK